MPVHYSVAKGGGAETQVRMVMDEITKNNRYEIHFLCRRVPDYQPRSHRVWKIGSENGLGRYWTAIDALRIYRTLKHISPEILYQNVGCAYTGIAAMYAKRNGAKLIWHIASDIDLKPELAGNNLKSRFIKSLDRFILDYGIRNASLIAGQTQYQSMILEKKFGRKCDAFIPIGHPFPEHQTKKSEKVTVLWIAGVKPLKQPEIFVKLAQEINSSADARFVMIGHPINGEWFQRLTDAINTVPNLTYIGGVSQSEVNRRLEEGHILVSTSQYEGFSNTFVQAWMRQVPVVSLNADPDNTLVREGLGFNSHTFERLSRDVKLLIENRELREKMGKKARQYAHENHSVEKMTHCFLFLLESQ
jgi:glycosyltransferase involved in cell wall biosynthesis